MAAAAAGATHGTRGITTNTAAGSGCPAAAGTTVAAAISGTGCAATADLNVQSFKSRYRDDSSCISSSAAIAAISFIGSSAATTAAPRLDSQLITPIGNLVCGVRGS